MDKINRAWLHYTSRSSRKLTTTTEGERRKHELETLQADVARPRRRGRRDGAGGSAPRGATGGEGECETNGGVGQEPHEIHGVGPHRIDQGGEHLCERHREPHWDARQKLGDMPLEASGDVRGGELFERGVESEFTFECGHLGEITSILSGTMARGITPSRAFARSVLRCVASATTRRAVSCGEVVRRRVPRRGDVQADPRRAEVNLGARCSRSCVYLVTTYTSDLKGAWTDANVTMVIHGQAGTPERCTWRRGETISRAAEEISSWWKVQTSETSRTSSSVMITRDTDPVGTCSN